MKREAKAGQISGSQLFWILFVSRFASLMSEQQISVRSFLAELALTSILSAVVFLISRKLHSAEENKFVKYAGAVICIFLAGVSVATAVAFKEKAIILALSSAVIAVLISVSAIYAASLGIEAVSRFAPFIGVMIILSVIIGLLSNFASYRLERITEAALGSVSITGLFKGIDLPILYLFLAPKTAGGSGRALMLSTLLSYAFALIVFIFCFALMGRGIGEYPFPVFTLFQLGEIGTYNKLDILFSSSQLAGLFLKASALICCFGRRKVK